MSKDIAVQQPDDLRGCRSAARACVDGSVARFASWERSLDRIPLGYVRARRYRRVRPRGDLRTACSRRTDRMTSVLARRTKACHARTPSGRTAIGRDIFSRVVYGGTDLAVRGVHLGARRRDRRHDHRHHLRVLRRRHRLGHPARGGHLIAFPALLLLLIITAGARRRYVSWTQVDRVRLHARRHPRRGARRQRRRTVREEQPVHRGGASERRLGAAHLSCAISCRTWSRWQSSS